MSELNSKLLSLAKTVLEKKANANITKSAAVPADPGLGAGGGGVPGGPPPGDPASMALPPLPPGGDPAMAEAPVDPAMAAMGGGMMPPAMPAPAPGGGSGGSKKLDPAMLDMRMYYIQVQLSAIMNALNLELPPDALIMPPGGTAPPMEAAMQANAATQEAQAGPEAGGQTSAIKPIEAMQPAIPETEMGKQASENPYSFSSLVDKDAGEPPSNETLFAIGSLLKATSENESRNTQ